MRVSMSACASAGLPAICLYTFQSTKPTASFVMQAHVMNAQDLEETAGIGAKAQIPDGFSYEAVSARAAGTEILP